MPSRSHRDSEPQDLPAIAHRVWESFPNDEGNHLGRPFSLYGISSRGGTLQLLAFNAKRPKAPREDDFDPQRSLATERGILAKRSDSWECEA